MASSEQPAVDAETFRAIGGVVRLLCEVRLAVLALGVATTVAATGMGTGALLIAALAAPFSYVPARSWERRGALLSRSGILLTADMVTTVIVILVLEGSDLMIVYAAATVALLGVVVGTRLALLIAVPIGVSLFAASTAEASDEIAWAVIGAGVVGVGAMAWAGSTLGRALRSQADSTRELASTQARRAATIERVRIARDLHDTVAGDLAGAILLGQALVRRLEAEDASGTTRRLAGQLLQACTVAHNDTRIALGELRRADSNVVEDLSEICVRWSARTQIACDVTVDPGLANIDGNVHADVRAILLELLENVRKHAGARRVAVRVDLDDDMVRLALTDDGTGALELEGSTAAFSDDNSHFGLVGITERARARGGAVDMSGAPEGGLHTVVSMRTTAEAS